MSNVPRAARGEPAHQHINLQSVAGQERVPIAHIHLSASQNQALEGLILQSELSKIMVDAARPSLVAEYTATTIVRSVLTDTQYRTITQFTSGAHTAVIINNLPVGQLGDTPADGFRPDDKDVISEVVLLGFASILGYAMGYQNEKNGEIIQQVVPIDDKKMEDVKNSNASRNLFNFHVDNIFIKPRFRQELIGLLCLRNPSAAATLLIDLYDLITRMSASMVEALMSPCVRFGVSTSFDMGNGTHFTEPRPLLYTGADNLLRINANTYNMFVDNLDGKLKHQLLSAETDPLLRDFAKIVEETKPHRVVLQPGQLLFFRDDMAMHGREPFEGERWLQRVYVRFNLEDLWALTGNRSSRVFDVKDFFFR